MRSEEKSSNEKNTVLRSHLDGILSGRILDVVKNFDELTITLSDKDAKESFRVTEGL